MPLSAIRNYFFPINPVTGRREVHLIPTSIENLLGARSYAPLIRKSGGEITKNHPNPDYQWYVEIVQKTGKILAQQAKRQDLQWEFTVIDSPQINAWCLPGGKIGINLGLIEKMDKVHEDFGLPEFRLEEKIAAILSHEMIHADARHTGRALEFHLFLLGIVKAAEHFVVYLCVHLPYTKKIKVAQDKTRLIQERDEKAKAIRTIFERASSFLIQGITLCNSRSHELESDRFGMRLIRDAVRKTIGSSRSELTYDSPQAAIWLQEYFRKLPTRKNNFLRPVLNLFSTHPTPQERLEANQKSWDDLKHERL